MSLWPRTLQEPARSPSRHASLILEGARPCASAGSRANATGVDRNFPHISLILEARRENVRRYRWPLGPDAVHVTWRGTDAAHRETT